MEILCAFFFHHVQSCMLADKTAVAWRINKIEVLCRQLLVCFTVAVTAI